MGISAVSQPQTLPASTIPEKIVINPKNFHFLIPTITVIALGIIFVPYFSLGLAAGFCTLIGATMISSALSSEPEEKNSVYVKGLRRSLLRSTVFVPIAEEALFRGGIQPLLTKTIQVLIPAASAIAFGPFSIATTVSIVATSIAFGAIHYDLPHKDSHIQAIVCVFGGLVEGVLCAQFGIGASIACHIANNTLCAIGLATRPSNANDNIPVRPRKGFNFSPLPA